MAEGIAHIARDAELVARAERLAATHQHDALWRRARVLAAAARQRWGLAFLTALDVARAAGGAG